MTTGSCNCQSVSFEVSGDIKNVVNCHCGLCRGMNGTPFSTYAVVVESDFRLISGELSLYSATESAEKYFCGKCGTPIYNRNSKYSGLNMVYFGTLKSRDTLAPAVNIFGESKVDWLSGILD
ncbi:GFA family protein [Enterovibrio coralii]|uniref:Aldehyde-activating protein n=1 Tax=Enterovibrio coralii TaxID=294935 RepID=A0A135I8Z1_9GAMM|nr:GFA family protein [Enterovibrio coralii]KXF81923.1 aldehyde-activating protein [Enterovibrio coralii]